MVLALQGKSRLDIVKDAFRAYDIRGTYPEQIDEDLFYQIGKSIATKIQKESNEKKIIICMDGRLTGPILKKSLIAGLIDTGIDIIDIGILPTPLLYFSLYHLKIDNGLMITGSHNPKNYNGIKIVINKKTLFNEHIMRLFETIKNSDYVNSREKGVKEFNNEIVDEYINEIRTTITIKNPFKVVIDCGNGVTGAITERIFKIFFKNNFSSISLMLDFPNMENCDTDEWDAIVDKFIKVAKKYKNGSLISSLSDTMPKHIRDKCIKNGVSPLQGMREALFTIKKAIEIGSIWKKESPVNNYKVENNSSKNIKTYSEFESKKLLNKIGIKTPKGLISNKNKLKKDSTKIGFPLVAKIHSNEIFHKSELNGVITNIKNMNELITKTKTFKDQILLEKMVDNTIIEILIGIKKAIVVSVFM